MKLHLLDGTYELFRSYFGAPKRTAPNGQEIGAIAGIIASTLSLLGEGVTHIAAAFDTVIRSYRNELYLGYKSEAGVPEDLLVQFPIAERAMEAMGVVVWSMIEFEADDAIATAANRYYSDFEQIIMLTPDKDLSQCVEGDRVVTFDRRKRAFVNEAGVIEKFGVGPASIPDYLGLVGDSSDGFPGVTGWGAKSAAAVLSRYPHIEDIPLSHERWDLEVRGAARLAENLRAEMSNALLFRFLALTRLDVPLVETGKDLEWPGVHREPFEELCDEYGLDRLRDRPGHWAAL